MTIGSRFRPSDQRVAVFSQFYGDDGLRVEQRQHHQGCGCACDGNGTMLNLEDEKVTGAPLLRWIVWRYGGTTTLLAETGQTCRENAGKQQSVRMVG